MTYYLFVIVKFIIGFVIVIQHVNISGVIYSDSIPLTQYIILLLIGVSFISAVNWVSKHINFFRSVAIGNPIPIIKTGYFSWITSMKKEIKLIS